MSIEQSRGAADATLALPASCLLPQVAALCDNRPDGRLAPMLRARALALIVERHLLDPDLGVEFLCKRPRLSRTSLYELFSDRGGVASLVRAKRLDEAFRRLVDLSRTRERFVCSPTEARNESEAPGLPPADERPEALAARYEAAVRSLRG